MTQSSHSKSTLTIGVLYGFRALMVLFVCQYHFWQQSWISQYITIFGQTISFDFFTRSGYLFVDGMVLLSGFLLYLPHAEAAEYAKPYPKAKPFYLKRFMRIVPSYLASVLLLLFLVALPSGTYLTTGEAVFDLLTHFTFTFPFFRSTYLYTPLNGVLWTIGIEVQFYLLFPLIARAMRKRRNLTLGLMLCGGFLYRILVGILCEDLSMLVNQMPSFLDVYAMGMIGSILYFRLQKLIIEHKSRMIAMALSTPVFIGCVYLMLRLLRFQSENSLDGITSLRLSQLIVRFPFVSVILLMILSATMMPKILQKVFDNRLTRFIATISMNMYIWHQLLSAQFIKQYFPDTLQTDLSLQTAFMLLSYSLSIIVAMIFTYGLEQPCAKYIKRFFTKNISQL